MQNGIRTSLRTAVPIVNLSCYMKDNWTVRTHLAGDGLSIGVQDSAHRAIGVALHDRAIRQVNLQQTTLLTSRRRL